MHHEIYDELPLHHTESVHASNPYEMLTSSQEHSYEEQAHAMTSSSPNHNTAGVENFDFTSAESLTSRRCSGIHCKNKTSSKSKGSIKQKTSPRKSSTSHKNNKNLVRKQGSVYTSPIKSHHNKNLINIVTKDPSKNKNSFFHRSGEIKKFRNATLSQMNYLSAKTELLLHKAHKRVSKTQKLAILGNMKLNEASYHSKLQPMKAKCSKKSCQPTAGQKTEDGLGKDLGSILSRFYINEKEQQHHAGKRHSKLNQGTIN